MMKNLLVSALKEPQGHEMNGWSEPHSLELICIRGIILVKGEFFVPTC